ncbi:MAG: biotin/lipoyl-containing protein, partial [Pseudomonadota bacterium]
SASSVLAAAEAGADAVDAAMDAFSGGTSQPCIGSLVEALRHTPRETTLDPDAIREISDYWASVRRKYAAFEAGVTHPASEVYLHEMPGGQVTNLRAQARSMGLETRWQEIARTYADVNQMFGDVIKVTPIAKTVGDMALSMVSAGLTKEDVLDPDKDVSFPDSVVTFMKGEVGQPFGGFPEALQAKVLKGEAPITQRPGALLDPVDLEETRATLAQNLNAEIDDEDLCGYLMYPKVFTDYMTRHADYGPVRTLPTPVFFYGMEPAEEISVEIDPGKTLEIRLQAVGETNEEGQVRVFFELNGQPRTVRVPNRSTAAASLARPKADSANPSHVGAPMPGVVASVAVSAGQSVSDGDLLLTIEAMKMETGIYADRAATVAAVHVTAGAQIDVKDLLVELGEADG